MFLSNNKCAIQIAKHTEIDVYERQKVNYAVVVEKEKIVSNFLAKIVLKIVAIVLAPFAYLAPFFRAKAKETACNFWQNRRVKKVLIPECKIAPFIEEMKKARNAFVSGSEAARIADRSIAVLSQYVQ